MSVWAALLILAFGQANPARPQGPPTLIVQVVDPIWLPVPGIQVAVIGAGPGGERKVGRTSQQGFADFWVARGAAYSIEVHHPSYRKKHIDVRLGKSDASPTAYVQVQFELRHAGPSE